MAKSPGRALTNASSAGALDIWVPTTLLSWDSTCERSMRFVHGCTATRNDRIVALSNFRELEASGSYRESVSPSMMTHLLSGVIEIARPSASPDKPKLATYDTSFPLRGSAAMTRLSRRPTARPVKKTLPSLPSASAVSSVLLNNADHRRPDPDEFRTATKLLFWMRPILPLA